MIWVGLAFMVLGLGLVLLSSGRRRAADQRLIDERFEGVSSRGSSRPTTSERGKDSPGRGLRADREFARALSQLGWTGGHLSAVPYLAWLVSIVLGVALGLLWGASREDGTTMLLFGGLAGGTAGLMLFKRFVLWRAARRLGRIKAEMPMVIRLLRLLLNAGLAYEMALRRVAEEGESVAPELASEFRRVLRWTSGGMPLTQALAVMEGRLDENDISRLVGVLRQLISLGGSVDRSLSNLAEDLEKRRESTLREQVNKAAGKMSLIMMLFLFPALLIVLAGPAIISLGRGLLELSS
ncbi:type II secretion system F family protein [Guyparkeria sp.]|uniref:type II secretion system F family protein n=1 Tax=Guyparkeria sp. TaxID=2035736 RepID=UPI003970D388